MNYTIPEIRRDEEYRHETMRLREIVNDLKKEAHDLRTRVEQRDRRIDQLLDALNEVAGACDWQHDTTRDLFAMEYAIDGIAARAAGTDLARCIGKTVAEEFAKAIKAAARERQPGGETHA